MKKQSHGTPIDNRYPSSSPNYANSEIDELASTPASPPAETAFWGFETHDEYLYNEEIRVFGNYDWGLPAREIFNELADFRGLTSA